MGESFGTETVLAALPGPVLTGPYRALPDLTVVDLFTRYATRDPEAVALVADRTTLTYGELDAAATRLARDLTGLGVGSGQVVAVATSRAAAAAVGMLAVWRAGAVYLPLDPGYPVERTDLLLRDSGAVAVLADGGPVALTGAPVRAALPEGAAYVIYTSGSTGVPKGVVVGHRSLLNVVLAMGEALDSGPGQRWAAMAPTTFDISLLELCAPLATGAALVLPTEADLRDAYATVRLLRTEGVTRMQAVPAQWRMLLDAGFDAPDMVAMVGGEALGGVLAGALRRRVRTLLNGYGPTETTVVSTYWPVPADPVTVSIGTPIANTRAYLLDDAGGPVPPGEPGELYLAGEGVALGYLGAPDLTAQRFAPDPDGGLRYRTGDRARLLPDGTLEYLGREDGQVKVRGRRVELGEVETHLAAHPGVGAVAVVVDGDALVAYVVGVAGAPPPQPGAVRGYAATVLPPGAVPTSVVVLPELPLTRNGKVDRASLSTGQAGVPEPDLSTVDGWLGEVCLMCRDVLGVPEVRPADDLFELGAHSLTIMALAARMRAAWDVEVPAELFYEAATVADVAAAVGRLAGRS